MACSQENYEGVTIDVCSKCRGVWLDQGEMEQIVNRRGRIFKAQEVEAVNRLCGANGVGKPEEPRNLRCPKCGTLPMKTLQYNYSSGIMIDRCGKGCGVWLDADELEKVQIHTELWQDKLEANRERFSNLAGQVESDTRKTLDALSDATDPSRFRFINAMLRGLIKFG
jgi:Zn-finger nucleic acid-binding protein